MGFRVVEYTSFESERIQNLCNLMTNSYLNFIVLFLHVSTGQVPHTIHHCVSITGHPINGINPSNSATINPPSTTSNHGTGSQSLTLGSGGSTTPVTPISSGKDSSSWLKTNNGSINLTRPSDLAHFNHSGCIMRKVKANLKDRKWSYKRILWNLKASGSGNNQTNEAGNKTEEAKSGGHTCGQHETLKNQIHGNGEASMGNVKNPGENCVKKVKSYCTPVGTPSVELKGKGLSTKKIKKQMVECKKVTKLTCKEPKTVAHGWMGNLGKGGGIEEDQIAIAIRQNPKAMRKAYKALHKQLKKYYSCGHHDKKRLIGIFGKLGKKHKYKHPYRGDVIVTDGGGSVISHNGTKYHHKRMKKLIKKARKLEKKLVKCKNEKKLAKKVHKLEKSSDSCDC